MNTLYTIIIWLLGREVSLVLKLFGHTISMYVSVNIMTNNFFERREYYDNVCIIRKLWFFFFWKI